MASSSDSTAGMLADNLAIADCVPLATSIWLQRVWLLEFDTRGRADNSQPFSCCIGRQVASAFRLEERATSNAVLYAHDVSLLRHHFSLLIFVAAEPARRPLASVTELEAQFVSMAAELEPTLPWEGRLKALERFDVLVADCPARFPAFAQLLQSSGALLALAQQTGAWR